MRLFQVNQKWIGFGVMIMILWLFSCDKENFIDTPVDNSVPTDTKIEDAWVYFKDKPSKNVFLADPLKMVSARSKTRREKQNIPFVENDVPIESSYYSAINSSKGIVVLAKSKWLNALHIQGTKTNINALKSNSFVLKVEYADKSLNTNRVASYKQSHHPENKFGSISAFDYGGAYNQIKMIGGDVLHNEGFTGTNMIIAIFDAGFPGVNAFPAFKRLHDNNKILKGYNLVKRGTSYYTGSSHGTSVLSTIGGFSSNPTFVGTAPDASFYLFITEDDSKEVILEESLWVEAAELADSLGVDIINSSLGYTTYDYKNHSHKYEDMNGSTTFISRGAAVGASKGIIIVNSAGNEGASPWKYISAPADVAGVLSVGAVDFNKTIASFSSFGPTFDSRVKPDVVAQGKGVYVVDGAGGITTSNGTSFASPILAGVIACFWQKYPTKTSKEIIQMVKSSAHLYNNPTNQEGYGIPFLN